MKRLPLISLVLFAISAGWACSNTGAVDATSSPPSSGAGGSAGAGGGIASLGGKSGTGTGGMSAGGADSGCTDSDGDGIADSVEGMEDPDKDDKPNALDDDSDGDGLPDKDEAGDGRETACAKPRDTDNDGKPDYLDLDSDNDGLPDSMEIEDPAQMAAGCHLKADCDGDDVIDLVEVAAGSDPNDKGSTISDATLYFILPYSEPEKTKDFAFSTGVKDADIYFMIDTTGSMQPTIDNVRDSLDSKIIPTILNGDPKANPPIPAIPGAWVGIGDFRDVPMKEWGDPGDDVYRNTYSIGGNLVRGNVAPPEGAAPSFTAPGNVKSILDNLTAAGGGDDPEATTQALYVAASGANLLINGPGTWASGMSINGSIPSTPPVCEGLGTIGTPCFRQGTIPIFVIITDAPFHNGSLPTNDYPLGEFIQPPVGYDAAVGALKGIGAKIVGVPVEKPGSPGAARADLEDLATKTESIYFDPQFGGTESLLVTGDAKAGDVSTEVIAMIGRLAGQGLNNVTTTKENYDCPGAIDCTGDGKVDIEFHNPVITGQGSGPFDGSKLITAIEPVTSTEDPLPYASLDATTFYGVRGDKTVTFKVHAKNDVIKPSSVTVLRAKIRVQTPAGQTLGGADGVKAVYFVVPPFIEELKLSREALMRRFPRLGWHFVSGLFVVAAASAGCGSAGGSSDNLNTQGGPTTGAGGGSSMAGAGGMASAGKGGSTVGSAGVGGNVIVTTGGAAGVDGGEGGSGGMAGKPGSSCLPDEDGDNIPDDVEGKDENRDTDGDGKPDYLDDDSDGDTIPDSFEGQTLVLGCKNPLDSDKDGKADYVDDDSDGNGVPDRDEIYPDKSAFDPARPPANSDDDKTPDYADKDNDNDSFPDTDELVDGQLVDTDGDGVPDIDDQDSDGDGIGDQQEGIADPDGDGKPNFRDDDSDGDGLLDSCEAGPGYKLGDVPPDSDKDGKYNFVDLDSDADGILDADEDANLNCVYDDLETDPTAADTDGDGVSDLIEKALDSDPRQGIDTPYTHGKLFFVLPYQKTPEPEDSLLSVKLALQKADVAFVLDTTGTMAGELADLKTGIASLAAKVSQSIPQAKFGVVGHDDYPVGVYGDAAQDLPFYVPSNGKLTGDVSKVSSALSSMITHNGGDSAESHVLAMWRTLTNDYYQWPGNLINPDPSVDPPQFGALGFRKDALPIIVSVTDAPFHNGRFVSTPDALHDTYSFNGSAPYPPPTIDQLVDVMDLTGAKFIGIASNDGVRKGNPYEDMAYLVDKTGSYAKPSAFGGTQCLTGIAGSPLLVPDSPDETQCRLIFDIYQTGVGVSERVGDGIEALLRSLVLDVRVVAISVASDDPEDLTDTVDTFIDSIELNKGGDDPTDPASGACFVPFDKNMADRYKGAKGEVLKPDGYRETLLNGQADQKVCYKVTPLMNMSIPPKNVVQTYRATLQVKARTTKNSPEIDFGPPRDVFFVVPPLAQ